MKLSLKPKKAKSSFCLQKMRSSRIKNIIQTHRESIEYINNKNLQLFGKETVTKCKKKKYVSSRATRNSQKNKKTSDLHGHQSGGWRGIFII